MSSRLELGFAYGKSRMRPVAIKLTWSEYYSGPEVVAKSYAMGTSESRSESDVIFLKSNSRAKMKYKNGVMS
jgi:hypothetical protein